MRRSVLAATALLALSAVLPAAAQGTPGERLRRVFADEWEARLRDDPLLATGVGDHRFDDRLAETGPAAARRRLEAARTFLARVIDYMARNSALTLTNITNEVDRYIA